MEAADRLVITKLIIQTLKMVWRYLLLALVKSSSLNYSLPELNLSKILEYLSWTIHGRFSDMIRIRIYDSGSLSLSRIKGAC